MICEKLVRTKKKSFWFKKKSFRFLKNVVKRNSKEKLYYVPLLLRSLWLTNLLCFKNWVDEIFTPWMFDFVITYVLFEKLSLNQHKNICTSNTELWNVIVEQLITLSVSLVDLALDIGHHTNHEMRNWWPQMVSCQMHNLKVSKSQKQISIFSIWTKKEKKKCISVLASYMSQLKKGCSLIMLISDYLSSNITICICFFYLAHFRELGQIFLFAFGSSENFKICFRELLTFSKTGCGLSILGRKN